jgi:hypothetical protein
MWIGERRGFLWRRNESFSGIGIKADDWRGPGIGDYHGHGICYRCLNGTDVGLINLSRLSRRRGNDSGLIGNIQLHIGFETRQKIGNARLNVLIRVLKGIE